MTTKSLVRIHQLSVFFLFQSRIYEDTTPAGVEWAGWCQCNTRRQCEP